MQRKVRQQKGHWLSESLGKKPGKGGVRNKESEIIVSERTEAMNISGWEQGEPGLWFNVRKLLSKTTKRH